MAKYKVGDIFISHTDGKILQVCEGGNCKGCCYNNGCCERPFSKDVSCTFLIGFNCHFKELPILPPGTKVKVREDLKVGVKYGKYTFVEDMEHCVGVTIEQYNATYKTYNIIEDIYNYTIEMFDQVINEPKENNMETKEIKIKVPEGYEIDKENSTLECIKFKPIKKELTYEDVAEELFDDSCWYLNTYGIIRETYITNKDTKLDADNATNALQLNRLMALNQLLNIAEYYNKKSPKEGEYIYCISLEGRNFEYFAQRSKKPRIERGLIPEFNREEDAKAVINNPNFKEILDLVYKGDED